MAIFLDSVAVSFRPFLGVVKAVALAFGFQYVDAVRQPIQQRAGEPFVSKNLRLLLEGQVADEDQALAFVGPAHDVKEQFGPGLGERHVPELVQHDEVVLIQSPAHALEHPVFAFVAGDKIENTVK